MTSIQGQLDWWLPTAIVGVAVSGAVLTFGIAARSRPLAIAKAIIAACGGGAALLAVAVNYSGSAVVILVWALLCAFTVLLVLNYRKEQMYVAVYAFGIIGVIALTTHAYQAGWPPASALVPLAAFAGLASIAAHKVGPHLYTRMVDLERKRTSEEQTPSRKFKGTGVLRLVLSMSTGVGVLAAAVPLYALLGTPLGLDVPTKAWPPASQWANTYTISAAAALSLAGLAVAWATRPMTSTGDAPHVNPVAAILALGPSIGLAISVLHDVVAAPPTWPPVVIGYIIALAIVVAVFYAEDFLVTAVRLHLLRETVATRLLTFTAAATACALIVWMIERQLWIAPWQGVTLPAALVALGQFSLGMTCVAAAYFILAFSTSSEKNQQQLTVRSTASNGIQGQVLYIFLAAATCWLPSILLARLNPDWTQNVKPLIAFSAVTYLLYRIYAFTTKMNAEHFASELAREIPLLNGDKAKYHEFYRRLRAHLAWQKYATLVVFGVSVVWILVIVSASKTRIEDSLPTRTTPLPDAPSEERTDAERTQQGGADRDES